MFPHESLNQSYCQLFFLFWSSSVLGSIPHFQVRAHIFPLLPSECQCLAIPVFDECLSVSDIR